MKSQGSLESLLQSVGSVTDFLRNQQVGPNAYPGVPAEYTNWRDEQSAWQKSCVLFNQSYHMADLLVEGRDALKLLSFLGVNSFEGFAVNKAKQFVSAMAGFMTFASRRYCPPTRRRRIRAELPENVRRLRKIVAVPMSS
jgi:hypothetical protein